MKLGLHLPDFTQDGGPAQLGGALASVARTAEEAGFDRISTMDHHFQIQVVGPPEHEMLEAYTTLGFLAAHTSRVKLLAVVTGVVYRQPGLLVKAVTTLDVLSGGRAMLGIGAAWFEEEARGLGFPFPPLGTRFEMLEETLQIAHQMWKGDDSPYHGRHFQLERTLCSPLPLSKPHPPILIGGSGEKKTLRLVAKYADACNIFPGPELPHKLDVLREHCATEGRDYDDIEKTVITRFTVGKDGENVESILEQLREWSDLGIEEAHATIEDVYSIRPLEILGEKVIPEMEAL